MNLKEIENIIGYKFTNKNLLQTAFVHSSYSNEHKVENNEKLEFLGDAVLELVITDELYSNFDLKEGKLTQYRASLVSQPTLAFVIEELQLDKFLLVSKGVHNNASDSKAIKCDLYEAIVGAIYVDGGFAQAKKFILSVLGEYIANLKVNGLENDAKSALQELLVGQKIVYSTTKHGLSHNPFYKSTAIVNGVNMGYGEGTNKKSAEQVAAKNTIKMIKKA